MPYTGKWHYFCISSMDPPPLFTCYPRRRVFSCMYSAACLMQNLSFWKFENFKHKKRTKSHIICGSRTRYQGDHVTFGLWCEPKNYTYIYVLSCIAIKYFDCMFLDVHIWTRYCRSNENIHCDCSMKKKININITAYIY